MHGIMYSQLHCTCRCRIHSTVLQLATIHSAVLPTTTYDTTTNQLPLRCQPPLSLSLSQTNKYHGLPEVLLTPDTIVLNTWRLISFVLSLLMAFRINRTYDRYASA